MPDYRGMPVLLSDATDACVRCGTTDRTSIVEIRPHAVWCCADCYAAVLRGEPAPLS
jgi:hypothetical protein